MAGSRPPGPAPASPRPGELGLLTRSAAELDAALLAWFERSGRRLPVRQHRDPWFVLILEVMSQQTQLARAVVAAERFQAAFPTPAALAAAPRADVLRAWSGLGYNRRAVALHEAAATIVSRHGGAVPGAVAFLEALPGVGPYTARAVAAQAFARPVGPVDVNVRRVLGRLVGRDLRPAELQPLADALVDPDRPGTWTHATMDLAVLVCLRGAPRCPTCPIRPWCSTGLGAAAGREQSRSTDRARPRPAATPFRATRRWLRGALVRELADAPRGEWMPVIGARGSHGPAAVLEALETLARDGLVELGSDGLARLSLAAAP